MAKHSKDLEDEVSVLNELLSFETEKEIRAFIKGEGRESVLDAAQERINEIIRKSPRPGGERPGEGASSPGDIPKQGQEPGPITKNTAEFKGSGVEGTKGQVRGEDVIEELDKVAGEKAAEALRKSAVEETAKEAEAAAKPKAHVTIDDVLARMRSEGRKV